MAPIRESTVDGLRDLVEKLESRVEQLETKLAEVDGGPAARKTRSNSGSIRMILMGPPGAGMETIRVGSGIVVLCTPLIHRAQERERKHPRSRKNTVPAIW